MSDHLKPGEELSHGMRRIVRKQLARILVQLARGRPEFEGRLVHEARKGLKKVRAELRLVADELGQRIHQREDHAFRMCGHALARQRDAEVLVRTLEKLCRRHNEPGAAAAIASFAQVLSKRQKQILAGLRAEEGRCIKILRAARKRVKDWPMRKLAWADMAGGIEKTYERGSEAFRDSEQTLSDECLHEWRRRVKDLWYQLCLLESIHPRTISRLAGDLRRLSNALGNDHDLALLAGTLPRSKLEAAQAQLLFDLIRRRRAKLQRLALALGRRLYAKKPAAFARCIRRFCKTWRRR